MSIAIKVENLSKQYRLGQVGTGTLGHDLNRWWHKMRGKEDPYLKVSEANDRSIKGNSEYVWALKDINFEVQQGEVLGIIGRNGAGKSTLLKILSRTTSPTTGSIKIKGRVASLLEVGTGFHPELSGRENIFLNGAILGMTKQEIKSRFDEIVDFSGVERYIDTPVKRYSSGMYVRLAFSVAAHLESEILIVDEVLAVGDAEFQKKCLEKMGEVSKGEGRTILFVSHNLLAIKSLCTKSILISNGLITSYGNIEQVMMKYMSHQTNSSFQIINQSSSGFNIETIQINDNGLPGNFDITKDLEILIETSSEIDFRLINVNVFFKTYDSLIIFATCSNADFYECGNATFKCIIPANTLNDNVYLIDILVVENGEKSLLNVENAITIEGIEPRRDGSWLGKFPGILKPTYFKWEKN